MKQLTAALVFSCTEQNQLESRQSLNSLNSSLSRLMHDDLQCLVIPQRVQCKLAVTVHRCLQHWAATSSSAVCHFPKFLVSSIWASARCPQLSVQRDFAVARLGFVRLLSLDQQSGIHCLIICGIQLLTPNSFGWT